MKILLVAINAKYIHANPAVYSLMRYATKKKPELASLIDVAEYTINNQKQAILADLYQRNPNVIGISCYIWNIELVKSLLRDLKKVLPNVRVWLGGPEVTYNPEELLGEFEDVLSGVFIGEGEQSFLEVCCAYVWKAGDVSSIHGICYRDETSGAIVKKELKPLTDLDELPFLYQNPKDFENKIIYYESSRGCPYRCSYCLSSIDKTVRFRSLELVKKELAFFLKQKVPQVKFVDRTFNCNRERTLEIWKFIKEHDNGVTNFHFEIAADIINEEELEMLLQMRPGAVQLEIGVQSTNPKTIAEIHRTMNFARVKEVTRRIHEGRNVHAHLDLIAGLPYEDYTSFQKSFQDVFECYPEQLQLGFLKVLKGSYMYEHAQEYELVYTKEPPFEVLHTKWLSYREVLRLKQIEEMVELYYNSNQYRHILPALYPYFENAFDLFENLARFYEENGYFIHTPARLYRYEILFSFCQKTNREASEFFRELLTFDAYLRENCKKRPDFAKETTPYKEILRRISAANKTKHIEIFTYAVWKMDTYEKELSFGEYKLVKPKAVLFDYEKRDPLTYEAAYEICELEDADDPKRTD